MNELTADQRERLLEALPNYVTLIGTQMQILWCNAVALRDFGEPAGRSCREFFGVTEGPCSECSAREAWADALNQGKEMNVFTRSGVRLSVLVHCAPLRDHGGEIVGFAHTAVDITHVREIRRQLILLGQTVAGMAHSIKNIMMGLDGGIYVVNKGLEAGNREEVKEGWEMVLLNFDKISHIVKDILYCSKEREPNLQTVDPNQVVREVYDLFKDVARSYAVELKLDLREDVKGAVLDPQGLHTVLSNLTANAIDACMMDFSRDDHLVEIRTRRGPDDSVVIEVADNGVGIDKKVKEHVFEDFFTSKGDKGTGLGLMVTRKILREHGGSITFRSRPGEGTAFTATFPHAELPQGA